MLRAFGLLLVCQLVGETMARGLGWPVPGPVIGLVLLAAGLLLAGRLGRLDTDAIEATELGRTAAGLLAVLGILFVPAGVGLIQHLDLIAVHGLALAAALVGSTAITLVVTVWVFIGTARWLERRS